MNKILYLIYLLGLLLISCQNPNDKLAADANRNANIFPDYTEIVIPNNIAPPNFIINDTASDYFVRITAKNGSEININSKNGNIQIPIKKWKKLLAGNANSDYTMDIYTFTNNSWIHFNTITNHIAGEPIDNYLVYRFINSANILWRSMGIYQRNIENFEVSPIMDNSLTDNNCMHCHSFSANNADNFMLHMRGNPGGTVIYTNNELKFVDTKTEHTISPGGYPSWHPNGKLIAFSTNKISQRFHATKEKYAFVFDSESDIILYNVEKNEVEAIPELSKSDFENMPTWSPDGKYLYFLTTPHHIPDTINYENIKYSLKRIGYDVDANTWGDIENIILADSIDKSVAFPRVSPDNRYIVFCLAEYGYFTVYNETSDIALLDLETREIKRLDINSNFVESYPSWSSNGKWILFNSKRDDEISSRPYFSYFDKGMAHKPFILPQKDAMWNFEELKNINRPEFVKSKVMLNPQQILKLVEQSPVPVSFNKESIKNQKKNNSTKKVDTNNSFNFDQ